MKPGRDGEGNGTGWGDWPCVTELVGVKIRKKCMLLFLKAVSSPLCV